MLYAITKQFSGAFGNLYPVGTFVELDQSQSDGSVSFNNGSIVGQDEFSKNTQLVSSKKKYISFCGEFFVPVSDEALRNKYPMTWHVNGDDQEVDDHYLQGVPYEQIDCENSLIVSIAKIKSGIGHFVADCSDGGWIESSFVVIDSNDELIRPKSNFNPNPVRQLVNNEY